MELKKRKGVRDAYSLAPLSGQAEVNPALRHYLKQLYDLDMPEFVDLTMETMDAFHATLQNQIRASEPGLTLHKIEQFTPYLRLEQHLAWDPRISSSAVKTTVPTSNLDALTAASYEQYWQFRSGAACELLADQRQHGDRWRSPR